MGVDVTFYVIDESSTKERTYAARVIELEKDYDLWIQFDRLPVQGHTGDMPIRLATVAPRGAL
jgi:hypothetical protein